MNLSELELEKSILTYEASNLHLSIIIDNKKIGTKLFDKKHAFPFLQATFGQQYSIK